MKGEVLMPERYADWMTARFEEEAMIWAGGDRVQYVAVHFCEFEAYCATRKTAPSYATLTAYAVEALTKRKRS